MGLGFSSEPFTCQNFCSEAYTSGPRVDEHCETPPVSVPTMRFSLSRRGDPEEPPSVEAVSQSLTTQKELGSILYFGSSKELIPSDPSSIATFLIPPLGWCNP